MGVMTFNIFHRQSNPDQSIGRPSQLWKKNTAWHNTAKFNDCVCVLNLVCVTQCMPDSVNRFRYQKLRRQHESSFFSETPPGVG